MLVRESNASEMVNVIKDVGLVGVNPTTMTKSVR